MLRHIRLIIIILYIPIPFYAFAGGAGLCRFGAAGLSRFGGAGFPVSAGQGRSPFPARPAGPAGLLAEPEPRPTPRWPSSKPTTLISAIPAGSISPTPGSPDSGPRVSTSRSVLKVRPVSLC